MTTRPTIRLPRNPFPTDATLREAWKEGYAHYDRSSTIRDCPYSPREEARRAAGWLAGWAAAQDDDDA